MQPLHHLLAKRKRAGSDGDRTNMASEAPPLSRVHYPLTALMYSSSSDSFVGDKSPPFFVFHRFEHNQLAHTLQE